MVEDTDAQIKQAKQIALWIAKPFEGFEANPYPDPATGGSHGRLDLGQLGTLAKSR